MKSGILLLFAVFFFSCGKPVEVKYVSITGSDENIPERLFLESLFEENGKLWNLGLRLVSKDTAEEQPSLFIELFSSLEYEYEASFGDILISKTFLAPRADPLDGRTNTALDACLGGGETLIAAQDIAPPFVALRVNGLALGDENYPLVRNVGIRIRAAKEEEAKTALKKINLIADVINSAPKPLISEMPQPFWVAAGGDLMLDQTGMDTFFKEGPGAVIGRTADIFASADIALLNLEGVVSGKGEKIEKSFNFRFVPELAGALRDAGIDAVLQANNHVFDFGKEAFLDSLLLLKEAGVGTVGAGINDEAACEPFILERGNYICKVFGIASFPREWNGWEGTSAAAGPDLPGMLHARRGGRDKLKVKLAKTETPSFNIVLFHGGTPWTTEPDSSTREIYTELVAAGADLVIGSHPHMVQGFEWVLGKPVFWSLGDLIFTGEENTVDGEEGLFIHLGFLGDRLLYLEPYALDLSPTKTDTAPAEKLEGFYALSRELRTNTPSE